MVTTGQLRELGFSPKAIKHRVSTRRLHPVRRGIYAVGRRELTRDGEFMAAVLGCGAGAALSHESAAIHYAIRTARIAAIHVSVPTAGGRGQDGITVHRRPSLGPGDVTRHRGIPLTTPVCTLIDLATRLSAGRLERAISEADKLDLIDPDALRRALERVGRRPGARILRDLLDRRTFTLTSSELERLFLPLARQAGLPPPLTGQCVNGYEVDFYWPELGLVVETDGLRYHRTPQQQARDSLRDQAHAVARLIPLRFTHDQIAHTPAHVVTTLAQLARPP